MCDDVHHTSRGGVSTCSHLSSYFSFSMEKEMFRIVVLPCFDLCRSNSFHVRKKRGEEKGKGWEGEESSKEENKLEKEEREKQ